VPMEWMNEFMNEWVSNVLGVSMHRHLIIFQNSAGVLSLLCQGKD
jgi:hypothetical protein